ncbi:HAD-IIA family hydrolase [Paenibacillus sp. 1P03SA]|uniref:HAD-IIA family hydrolase n=1 Tax=Paenibacillus sp. 1P03SA TaxID=3132294 RepID=UPI0039A08671
MRGLTEWNDAEAYFFDLDGTIFLGGRLLPGAAELLRSLEEAGKTVGFLTNTTTQTAADCGRRLRGLGLAVRDEQVVTAAAAAAAYLAERAPQARVLAVGEEALIAELDAQRIRVVRSPLEATHVVVGMDRRFDYAKLHAASRALRSGAELIACNPDTFCPVEGDELPDTGAMTAAIEAASGVRASVVAGKPSPHYARVALRRTGKAAERCVMIGDRLETDIMLGRASGMRTALVLTGAATLEEVRAGTVMPDWIVPTLEAFAKPSDEEIFNIPITKR